MCCQKWLSACVHQRQVAGCWRRPVTGSSPPMHGADNQLAAGMDWQQVAGPSTVWGQAAVHWLTPVTGSWLWAPTGDRRHWQHAAGHRRTLRTDCRSLCCVGELR